MSKDILTSHEYAAELHKAAAYLESRPEFNTEQYSFSAYLSFYDRDKFIVAAKAIGTAKKEFTDGSYPELMLNVVGAPIRLSIARDKVCKKTVTYDCLPLFSEEEIRSLDGEPTESASVGR